jgi:hypothetical protein
MPTPSDRLVAFAPAELAIYHRNPNLGNVAVIMDSLRAHGQYKAVVVNIGTHTGRPHEVLAGNHTLKAYRDLQEAEPSNPAWRLIDCYLVDVDDDRAARIVLVDNKSAEVGFGYDTEMLTGLLSDLDGDFTGTAFTEDDYRDILAGLDAGLPEDTPDTPEEREQHYTNDSMIPQYEPSGPPPDIGELMDVRKTTELLDRIHEAKLPPEIADFLCEAARRHTVIDYRKVANYYAHAPAHVQRLMEDSALVIIDMDDAIARGYVRLREDMKAMFDEQYAQQRGEDA